MHESESRKRLSLEVFLPQTHWLTRWSKINPPKESKITQELKNVGTERQTEIIPL